MFGFLNASVLFAAVAALIPLIIHLFSRRRVKVIEFSSLRHLKSMQRRQVRRLKIRQLLLLILRMLIILAVVMAFARPTTKSGQVGSHAAVSAVVLVDNSASMNRYVTDGNLFDITRRKVDELLETAGQADQMVLIPLDRTGTDGNTMKSFASAAVVGEQMQSLKAGFGRADFTSALDETARLITTSANLNREIYVVTDRQRNSLPENEALAGTDAAVYMIDLPLEEDDNCGVISVDFGGQLIQPGHDFDLSATIKNYSDRPTSNKIASLFLNGSRVAQTAFEIGPGTETSVRFTRPVSRTGFHSGYVEISDDKLLVDNRYYFSFHIPERFNLLIISDSETARYVSLALVPDQTLSQYWSVKEATPADLAGIDFSDYDVIMLAGAPTLATSYVSRLKAFVRRGNSLFVSYDATTDTDYFNNTWSEVTGVVYDEPVARQFTRAGYYSLQSITPEHPVFSVFDYGADEQSELPEIKFFALPRVHLEANARSLMQFTGNRPALTESVYGNGKVLCFTGPMSLEYTDLPGHAFFVPFISRIAEYLASDLSALDLKLQVGDIITRSMSLRGSITYPVELITPDSSRYSIPPEEDKGSLVITATPVDRPGIYHISYLGREIDRFAINMAPAEGDLASADLDELAVSMGVEDYRELGTDQPLQEAISGFRFGRELWQLFMWLAVLFVILEMLLARGSSRDDSSSGE